MLPRRLAVLRLLSWANRLWWPDDDPYCREFKKDLGSSPSINKQSLPQGYVRNRIDTQDLTDLVVSVFTAGIFKETLKRLDIYSNFFCFCAQFYCYILKGKGAEARRKRIGPLAIASGASEFVWDVTRGTEVQRVMMKEVGVRRLSAQWCREWNDEENCSNVSDSLSLTISQVQRQWNRW